MQDLINYIAKSFGANINIKSLDNRQRSSLPLYLSAGYDLYIGSLVGHDFIWAKVKEEVELTPDQLQKQGEQLKKYLNKTVVFVFNKLQSWQRKRLIERHIAFVQPLRQLYIPELMLQLNDAAHDSKKEVLAEKLSYPAQVALLYHLQVASLENILLQQLAEILHYSAMTVSRFVKELKSQELITVEGGKEKTIRFYWKGRDLWEKAVPLFHNPVKEIWFTDQDITDTYFLISNDHALSLYSMIAEGKQKSFAIGKEEFRSLKTLNTLKQLNKEFGTTKIEVWHYNPLLLSKTSAVDKLSLYLAMRDEDDERVQHTLQEMINEIQW